jgi:hypothetical protein
MIFTIFIKHGNAALTVKRKNFSEAFKVAWDFSRYKGVSVEVFGDGLAMTFTYRCSGVRSLSGEIVDER